MAYEMTALEMALSIGIVVVLTYAVLIRIRLWFYERMLRMVRELIPFDSGGRSDGGFGLWRLLVLLLLLAIAYLWLTGLV